MGGLHKGKFAHFRLFYKKSQKKKLFTLTVKNDRTTHIVNPQKHLRMKTKAQKGLNSGMQGETGGVRTDNTLIRGQ